MRLSLHGMGEARHMLAHNPHGQDLATIFGSHAEAIDQVTVQDAPLLDWQRYVPGEDDRLDVWLRPGTGIEIGALLIALAKAVAVSLIVYGITYGLQLLLTNRPDPTRATAQQRPEEAFGIAGLSNTVALGTPKTLIYGRQRVFGHIIGTQVELDVSLRRMKYGVLYYMGEGEISNIRDIEINDVPLAEYPGTTYDWRPGTADQSDMYGWQVGTQVYHDGRELQTPIVYQTRGTEVGSLVLYFVVPHLIFQENNREVNGEVFVWVRYKRVEETVWHGAYLEGEAAPASRDASLWWSGHTSSPTFNAYGVPIPGPGQWQVEVRANGDRNQGGAVPVLYNVQEYTYRPEVLRYPYAALLAVQGISSAAITSFEGMQVSALVDGRKVKVWNGSSYQYGFSRNRVWVVRDLLTEPRAGMGHRIPETLWDDNAALACGQYYNAEINGETRDFCDVLINRRRPAWDHVRDILTEGNAALIPSGGRLKYVIDGAKVPGLLYAAPGNIEPGTLSTVLGSQGPVPNTVRGEFRDDAHGYRLQVLEGVASDIGSESVQESTIQLTTITRESHALRALTYALNKSRKVVRRYTWQSPVGAIVSEPFDVVMLAYETPKRRHGVSGFLQAGSTTLLLMLDRLFEQSAGETYEVIVRIQRANLVYTRTWVATETGPFGHLYVAPALDVAPAAGDLYAIGKLGQEIVPVLIESVQAGDNDTYTIVGAEYRSDVYDTSGAGLVPQTTTNFFALPAMYSSDTLARYHASYQPLGGPGLLESGEPRPAPTEPWPGASLWRTEDDANTQYALSSRGAPLPVAGTTETVLASAIPQLVDMTSTVDVVVTGGQLSTITTAYMQAGRNQLMVGSELIQFRIATYLGTGTAAGSRRYRLSHLLRGRRGTEWAVGTHAIGETVVLIGTGVFTRDILTVERNRTRQWKSPTLGEDLVEATAQAYAAPSENLRPWTVGTPRARYQADGSWRLTWYGRARFLGEWLPQVEATPDYDVNYYVVTIYSSAARTTIEHTFTIFQSSNYQAQQGMTYTAAQQMTDFGAVQTTLYWNVQQYGDSDTSYALALVGESTE
jgi:hypothetical protein